MATIGDKVKALRKTKGMTLEELADAIGSGKSYIWELENRGVKTPSAIRLADLAQVFGVTTAYLLDANEDSDAPIIGTLDQACVEQFIRKYFALSKKGKAKLIKLLTILQEIA